MITALVLVALILAAFIMFKASSVRAQSSEAQVLSFSWYVSSSNTVLAEWAGDLVAVGEVQNVGSNIIGFMTVTGAAYNSSGQTLASAETSVFGNNLLPGQKAPFYLDFIPEDSVTGDQSWVPYATNVTVSVGYVNVTTATQYSGLAIQSGSVIAADIGGTYTVTGEIQNTGDQTTGIVWVVGTFYNSTGEVVAVNYTDPLVNSLSPGQSAPFTMTPTDNSAQLSNEIANYSVLIQSGPLTTSGGATPTLTPVTITSNPSLSFSNQSKQSPGLASTGLMYVAGATILVVVVVLVVLLLSKRRQKNAHAGLPPPPPPPPP